MANYRPFIVRRTTGGDVLRESDPLAWLATLRWGARVVTPEEVENVALITRPNMYDAAYITVQVPMVVEWEQAVLVRGGFGFPTTPQDGMPVWYTDERPMDTDGITEINLSQQVLDEPLTTNNWYYYSLFLWLGNQWVLGAQADVLVPKDWGWSQLLMASVPPFYSKTDDELAADGRNGPLRRFTSTLGYDLDYTHSLCEGVANVYSVDKAPWRLLEHLGANFGFPYEAVLGANRTRSILEQLDALNGLRGTRLGMERLITAASDYRCDVLQGYNELLAVDDGDFAGGGGSGLVGEADPMLWGVGHWRPLTNIILLSVLEDPLDDTFTAEPAATTPPIIAKNTQTGPTNVLLPPGGRGSLVVNGPGPQTVLACGTYENIPDPDDLTLVIPDSENDVILHGIPVKPGDLYECSGEFIRTAWGPAGEQPPSARLIFGIIWCDIKGFPLSADTGPASLTVTDSGSWQRDMIQAFAPTLSAYAIPVVWWRVQAGGTWAGAWTDPATRPTYGRYLAMVLFGTVQTAAEGGGVVPIGPDIFLTLGIEDKTLASDESYLGEPE